MRIFFLKIKNRLFLSKLELMTLFKIFLFEFRAEYLIISRLKLDHFSCCSKTQTSLLYSVTQLSWVLLLLSEYFVDMFLPRVIDSSSLFFQAPWRMAFKPPQFIFYFSINKSSLDFEEEEEQDIWIFHAFFQMLKCFFFVTRQSRVLLVFRLWPNEIIITLGKYSGFILF